MSKYLKMLIGVAIVVGLGVVGAKRVKEVRAKNAAAPKAIIYPIVVSSISPKVSQVKLTLPYLAEVANDKDVKLSARIAARIIKIKPSGSHVKKGDLIVKLDTTSIESSLSSVKKQIQAARITLQNLERTHKRTLELLNVKGVSIEESQKEENMIATAEASLNALKQKEIELKNSLSYATIISPVDGIVSKTFFNQGDISLPGKPMVAINSKNGFYLMVRVPREIPIQSVDFEGKNYGAIPLKSTFHGLNEYKVYTGKADLISGDKVEVDVIIFNQKAMLLPFDAILNRNSKSYVLVIDGDKAEAKEVHIVQSGEQGVIISENLRGKNIVIAKPDILLRLLSGYLLKVKE